MEIRIFTDSLHLLNLRLVFCVSLFVSVGGLWAWPLWSPASPLARSWWLMPFSLLPKLPWGLSCWRGWVHTYREHSPFFMFTFFTMHQSHCLCTQTEVTYNINTGHWNKIGALHLGNSAAVTTVDFSMLIIIVVHHISFFYWPPTITCVY